MTEEEEKQTTPADAAKPETVEPQQPPAATEKPKAPEPEKAPVEPEKPKTAEPERPKEVPAEAEKPEVPAPRKEENVVFIGRKPVMNYVMACIRYFNSGGKQLCVKARGRAISRAVDTIEVLRRSFVKDIGSLDIKIGTEEITREQGRRSNVSTIEITITKPQ